jgi:hypothetical protein
MPSTLESARAEALFVSTVQPSELPTADEVRHAVVATLRRWRISGCAVQVAAEFGDHPETAVARMSWALATVRTAYAGPSPDDLQSRRPRLLTLAS